jgi:hypothetical protein
MKSINVCSPAIDFIVYRRDARKNGFPPPHSATSVAAVDRPPANPRIELRVELDNLACKLLEIRRWLTDHGCNHQVFHCFRAGSEAVIKCEFDLGPGLADKFNQQFGALLSLLMDPTG